MNTIITIGRQFGSAGREIGEKVAEYFGIKCYDKELLTRAAQESGFCEEMIQNHDERPTNSFLYNLVMDTYSFGYNASSFVDMPISTRCSWHSSTRSRRSLMKARALSLAVAQTMHWQITRTALTCSSSVMMM